MSDLSLNQRISELEEKILSGEPLGPSTDMPFAIFVYEPKKELELRGEVDRLATRLCRNAGRRVEPVDLGELMWQCFEDHPAGSDELYEVEVESREFDQVIAEAKALVRGRGPGELGPLEKKVAARLGDLKPEESLAFLLRAGELFPVHRTSALLERLMRYVRVPTVLFYPGRLSGAAELSFMGVCEPSTSYRATIL